MNPHSLNADVNAALRDQIKALRTDRDAWMALANQHMEQALSNGATANDLREKLKDAQRSLDIAFEQRDNAQKLADELRRKLNIALDVIESFRVQRDALRAALVTFVEPAGILTETERQRNARMVLDSTK